MPEITSIQYKNQTYNYNQSSDRYDSANGNYITLDYKVFDANNNQIGQYYPPLAAAPNISWVLPALLITGFYLYVFRKDLKLIK